MNFCTFFHRVVILVMFLFAGVACSKKQSRSKVVMNFNEKSISANATQTIETIIINVKSSTGKFNVYEFECAYSSSSCSEVSFEVDSPGITVIQALVVSEGADEITNLNYKGIDVDLKGGDNRFNLELEQIGSFTSEAQVAGRYLPKSTHALAGKALTGEFVMSVKVNDGRPDMKIKKFEIFGGWFRLFVINSVGFKYVFNGHDAAGNTYADVPIFNDLHNIDGLKLGSAGLAVNGNEVVHYRLNSTVYERHEHNQPYHSRDFNGKILGFFGSNPMGSHLCTDSFSTGFVFDGQNGNSELCKNTSTDLLTCTNYFTWGDVLADSGAVPAALNGSTDSCLNSAGEFEVDLEDLGSGDDGMMGFYGPFLEDNSSGLGDIVTIDGPNRKIQWYIAPYVSLPAGLEVFIHPDIRGFDRHQVEHHDDDGVDCSELTSFGFQSQGAVTVNAGTVNEFTVPTALWGPTTGFALCPRKVDGGYYKTAIVTDGNDNPQIQLVEFEIYDSMGVPAPGFGFGDSNWNNGSPYIMDTVATSSAGQFYVTIKNTMDEDVRVDDVLYNFPFSGWAVIDSPGSPPSGLTGCGAPPFVLQANGTANDRCVVRVDFVTTGYNPGSSVANGFTVGAELVSDPNVNSKWGFPVVGTTYQTINYSSTGNSLDLYAPPGEIDVKYLRMHNDSGGPTWTPTLPANGSALGVYTIHYGGCISIPNGNDCFVKLIFHNTGGLTDNTQNLSSYAFGGGSSAMLDSTYYTSGPSVSEGNPYDFGSLTGNVNHDFIVTNNSAALANFGALFITDVYGGNANTVTDPAINGFCDSMSVSTTCDFRINIPYDPGAGFLHDWFFAPYAIGETYKAVEFDVLSDHQ